MNENRSIFSELFINLLSLVFIAAGLFMALPSAKNLYYIQTCSDWPQVAGHVVSSSVHRRWASRGDDLSQDYFARVWFSYQVNGHQYVSDGVSVSQPWTKILRSAEELASRYPAGKAVTVYYHPQDPGLAVLDVTAVSPMVCVFFGIGIFFVMTGARAIIGTLFRGVFRDPF